jgi:pimeloyl-ACP methyl ester carboxylesterase
VGLPRHTPGEWVKEPAPSEGPRRCAVGPAAAAQLGLALLLLGACSQWIPAPVPMRTLALATAQPPSRCLVVFLPGRSGSPENFAYANFAAVAAAAGVSADLLAADARLAYYYHRHDIVERLRQDVIAPARLRGYQQIWLVGVSIGATSALLYVDEHPQDVAGLFLIAPYLGDRRMVDEVAAAGGVQRYRPPADLVPSDIQHRLWRSLDRALPGGDRAVPVYLGYGDSDRFLKSDRLLAEALPAGHVFTTPGHHGWITWKRIWRKFVQSGALPRLGHGRAPAATP